MTAAADWRAADEALYERLREERLLRALFGRFAAPGAPQLGTGAGRGSVLVRSLAAHAGKPVADMEDGLADALLAEPDSGGRLAPPSSWPALLVHSAAVFWGRVAASWEPFVEDGGSRERYLETKVREQLAWFALTAHPSFFSDSARRVGSAEVPLDALVFRPVTSLTTAARAGIPTKSVLGAVSLEALARIDSASRRARFPEELLQKITDRIDRENYAIVDEALAALADSLKAARAIDNGLADGEKHMHELAALWRWSGRSIHAETFFLREMTPIGWHFARAGDSHATRRVFGPAIELLFSLEARILRDPMGQLTHAAGCAEVLLFWASADESPGAYSRFVHRAHAVCPSHRNGRLQVAGLLCAQADAKLDGINRLNARASVQEASALHERARGLFPTSNSVAATEKKLEAARTRWGIEEPPRVP